MSAPVGPGIQKDRSTWTDLPAPSPDAYMTQVYPIHLCKEHAPTCSTEAGVLDAERPGQLCSVRVANGLRAGGWSCPQAIGLSTGCPSQEAEGQGPWACSPVPAAMGRTAVSPLSWGRHEGDTHTQETFPGWEGQRRAGQQERRLRRTP